MLPHRTDGGQPFHPHAFDPKLTIGDGDRAVRSVIDHIHIIKALELRDAGLAETLVREHSMRLAEHIRKHVDDLD